MRASVEDLRSVGLDQIPVPYLRRLDSGVRIAVEPDQVVDIDDQVATMIALRDERKIGAFGLSGAVKPYALVVQFPGHHADL
jgi:pyridoxine 4-dehydrogenase